jgi:hypothetical protein
VSKENKSILFKVSEDDHDKLGNLAIIRKSSRSGLAKEATLALLPSTRKTSAATETAARRTSRKAKSK